MTSDTAKTSGGSMTGRLSSARMVEAVRRGRPARPDAAIVPMTADATAVAKPMIMLRPSDGRNWGWANISRHHCKET